MTIEYLKKATPSQEAIDSATSDAVQRLLADSQQKSRDAVEKYAGDFDGWSLSLASTCRAYGPTSGASYVGYTDSVPALLGAARFYLHTIVFSNDQSATNALIGRPERSLTSNNNAPWLKGGTVLLTGNSAVDRRSN